MINPDLLPSQSWQHYEENFTTVNGKLFTTTLITKKLIRIQIFLNCVIWTKVIGSHLPDKTPPNHSYWNSSQVHV